MPTKGDIVPSHFMVSVVIASYFASWVGCVLTVELLNRRGTGVRSKRSWIETFICAACLGLIGIWCMHFIGNRAIVLGDGSKELQLVYGPGYSVLSAFLPIIVLTVAFGLAELQWKSSRSHWIGLITTGVCSGLSVVGMHYVGNLGITNYSLQYRSGTFAASFIIAIGDCLTVMLLFYTWREKWISHWWKRLICASVLAAGISAMHFTAASNCIYHFKHYSNRNAVISRNIQVIIAGVFCGAAGLVVAGLIAWRKYRDRISKQSSKKIMLNCVMFHPDGRRFLVTTEGMLPAREITDKYNHRTFNEEFNTAHQVFHWIFRVTTNWNAVKNLIPSMKSHLNARRAPDDETSRPSSGASSTKYEAETDTDYSIIFRERFCVAAQYLANSMNISINRIGVLYENIIETGTLRSEDRTFRGGIQSITRHPDEEMAMTEQVYGTGHLLFLTRRLKHGEPDSLLNAGYKYAGMDEVGRIISNTMQIPYATLDSHISNIRRYNDTLTDLQKFGTWLSCFAIVPKVHMKAPDVIVKRSNQDQLPDAQLLDRELVDWQQEFLSNMHGWTFGEISAHLDAVKSPSGSPNHPAERQFATRISKTMISLEKQIPDILLDKAIFYGNPLSAHYSRLEGSRSPSTTIYSFVVKTELNATFGESTGVVSIPSLFYSARQQCYPGSPNHEVFAGRVHREFAPFLAHKLARNNAKANGTSTAPSQAPSITNPCDEEEEGCASDEYELIDSPVQVRQSDETIRNEPTPSTQQLELLGGIMVNNETVVKSDSSSDLSIHPRSTKLGVSTEVSVAEPVPTFVEELLTFAQHAPQFKFQ